MNTHTCTCRGLWF